MHEEHLHVETSLRYHVCTLEDELEKPNHRYKFLFLFFTYCQEWKLYQHKEYLSHGNNKWFYTLYFSVSSFLLKFHTDGLGLISEHQNGSTGPIWSTSRCLTSSWTSSERSEVENKMSPQDSRCETWVLIIWRKFWDPDKNVIRQDESTRILLFRCYY